MIVKNEQVLAHEINIGHFFDTAWEESELDTILYQNDEPVGLIVAWGMNEGKHVFVVRPNGEYRNEYEADPVAGELRFRNVIASNGNEHIAIDIVNG